MNLKYRTAGIAVVAHPLPGRRRTVFEVKHPRELLAIGEPVIVARRICGLHLIAHAIHTALLQRKYKFIPVQRRGAALPVRGGSPAIFSGRSSLPENLGIAGRAAAG